MKIAVSGCLLGEKVRFDSGHKRDDFVMDELSRYAEYISFCPENMAFSNPRPSIRLVKNANESLKVESNKTGADLSAALHEASLLDLQNIASHELRGIIFKSKSPSCGLMSAKVYLENGFAEGKDDGVFAAMCRAKFPLLPMEEEGRLCDAWLRENFVMQLFAYDGFEKFKANADMKGLVAFHTANKFMLQSKDETLYRELGKIVGNHEQKSFTQIFGEYEFLFKTAIAKKSSKGKTRNVLEHMSGFVKSFLNAEEKAMLHEQIDDYAAQIIPLIVPLSTLKLYASKYGVNYLLEQTFLSPYPKELALRSSVKCVK
ncbi:MAG: DUF523 and DUF1722 domain-containing protein [Sulfurimonas sp.]|nr:DUF523 and DUF1722 domain-containing protein [Sulfurimonas sp.]MBU3938173.1 DUF523 and DUF1722 domain-containing protein [bacterium]MBU4023945.1 DUF523 and DUF1722 domain-containing protein [bacterium]MBU4058306.1 DUF523 and DUF1722 domain-containing protein [bacterium]MBU4109953.1 DUF523 and DUF1722 domain-containing protein [bacterium]